MIDANRSFAEVESKDSSRLAAVAARFDMLPSLEEEVSIACAGKCRVLLPGVVTAVQIVIIVAP
jgi:2-keto-3-deoxy-6-phosphogluconate aldolase